MLFSLELRIKKWDHCAWSGENKRACICMRSCVHADNREIMCSKDAQYNKWNHLKASTSELQ